MINIAIVEDNDKDAAELAAQLNRYSAENGVEFSFVRFDSAANFIARYRIKFDIVFMDIDLPGMNGLELSSRLREHDKDTVLIFVTNLAQYAVKGYEVDALDFIVKPVKYEVTSLKMSRALARIARMEKESVGEVMITSGVDVYKIKYSSIKYIEVLGHKVIYHTLDGDYKTYGTLKKIQEEIGSGFAFCNSCYLVNLKYVKTVIGYTAVVDGAELKVSRPKRAEFIRALNDYICGGG